MAFLTAEKPWGITRDWRWDELRGAVVQILMLTALLTQALVQSYTTANSTRASQVLHTNETISEGKDYVEAHHM